MVRARTLRDRLRSAAVIEPEERMAAAMVSGVLYLLAGVALAIVSSLPGVPHSHESAILGVAAAAVVLGPISYRLLGDPRTPLWALQALQLLAPALVGAAVAASGGSASPYWFYIFIPALFTSYFYGRVVAGGWLAICVLVHALPLLYDARATHDAFLPQFASAAPAYVALGITISTGKRRIWALRAHAEMLAGEQGALRRVATAVASGEPAERIYAMVSEELRALFGCSGAAVLRRQGEDALLVVGAVGIHADTAYRPGMVVPFAPGSGAQRALAQDVVARVEHPEDAPVARAGYRSTMLLPVTVGDGAWGLLVVGDARPGAFRPADEQRLRDFGDLLATAVSSAEDRARLAEQAMTDALTGLANQRALHERLGAELARASRRGTVLSVALVDVDHFKEVNDTGGHKTGDEMLVRVAAALRSLARTEDTLARVGGDEFAWLLPDTAREQALVAVERARRLIAGAGADPCAITISAGICDSDFATETTELIRLADTALYWSKAHGRNQCWIYDPAVVASLSDEQRAVRLERAQAIEGLRALVRARENDDLATRGHSERVAALALTLAERAGWSHDRALLLSEAALVHDIGTIATRLAAGSEPAGAAALTPEGVAALREAAALSARIVEGVLDGEQVEWIRGQYGGAGEGAALLALADAWDRLTALAPGAPEAALEACERLGERCFTPAALAALRALLSGGEPVR